MPLISIVVVAVSRPSLVTETKKWVQMGYPVLCETPAADTVEDLKELWEMVQNGAKLQIAEQYHRYPILAAGLKAIADGKLADPYAVRLSMAHDYHGYSLIRRMLEPKEPMKHQYDFDAATAIGFLRQHGLDKDFKLNIEANHATLAGHTFQHELRISDVLDEAGAWQADLFIAVTNSEELNMLSCFFANSISLNKGNALHGLV